MIPIHLKKVKGAAAAPETTHYVVARNGLFVSKKMGWVDATVPVAEACALRVQYPSAKLLLPKLPGEIIAKALKLAKAVYDVSESEVCLLLHHGEKTGYQLTVPEQQVTLVTADYDASGRLPGALCIGTIHSHGRLHAFHSETDHTDEDTADGVHITLGNVDRYPKFSLSAELAINGNRFPVETGWFEGVTPEREGLYRIAWPDIDSWEVPKEWLDLVKHRKGFL
ncbi:MAG: Mov34/MPN/PAD-1 family protein [Patescibacteria group bacterium]